MVSVSAVYPGASARDVAQAVASPLEAQVNGVSHMLYMESTSANNGSYQLSITFASGTDPDMAAVEVQNRISQVSAQLPAEVNENGISVRKRASNLLLGVSVFSPQQTHDALFSVTTPAYNCVMLLHVSVVSVMYRSLVRAITVCVSGWIHSAWNR
ncbi:putative integral membrane efflux protein [Yersinia pseudotuberculosis]|nr:putative integral membrane efflux protein [Yersinia pseudotuberculosis]